MKTFIVTPSYINSQQRFEFAQKSFSCIYDILGEEYPFIVVDDIPRFTRSIIKYIPKLAHLDKCYQIYNKPHVRLVRQYSKGSRQATLRAVRIAKEMGAELIFIHLDDNIYLPILKDLIKYSINAFDRDRELLSVKLADYPILTGQCTPEQGNLTQLKVENQKILFDNLVLNPTRFEDYTLWWSYYNQSMVMANYWPISLWTALYRVDFLEELLDRKPDVDLTHLVDVEIYYRKLSNWEHLLGRIIKGKVGYINMQFSGIEMQNNRNWQELIGYPNLPVN